MLSLYRRRRLSAILYLTAALTLATGIAWQAACASAPAVNATTFAHYSADLFEALKASTDGVVTINRSGALPDDLTRTILGGVEKANAAAAPLEAALRVFDLATSLTAKQEAAAKVTKIINDVSTQYTAAFNVELPAAAVGPVNVVNAKVSKVVGDVQTSIAGKVGP